MIRCVLRSSALIGGHSYLLNHPTCLFPPIPSNSAHQCVSPAVYIMRLDYCSLQCQYSRQSSWIQSLCFLLHSRQSPLVSCATFRFSANVRLSYLVVSGYNFWPRKVVKRGICCDIWPSVCLSLCLSHLRVTPQLLKISKYALHHTTKRCL